MPFLRRILRALFSRRTLKVLAVLVTTLAALLQFENWRARRDWRAMEQQLLATRTSLDWRDMIPPPIPDEENAACHPFFAAARVGPWPQTPGAVPSDSAKTRSPGYSPGYYWESNVWADAIQDATSWNVVDDPSQPVVIEAVAARLRTWPGQSFSNPSADDSDVVLSATRGTGDFLAGMQQAFQRKGFDMMPLDASKIARPLDRPIPMWVNFHAVYNRLWFGVELRDKVHLRRGNSAAAANELITALQFSRPATHPSLIVGLAQSASAGMSGQRLCRLLAEPGWADEDLARIQAKAASLEPLESLQQGLEFEMRYQLAQCLAPATTKWNAWLVPACMRYRNAQLITEWYTSTVLPQYDAQRGILRTVPVSPEAMTKSIRVTPYTVMALIGMPELGPVHVKAASAQRWLDLGVVSCAARRYRLAEGKWPETLADLVPRFLEGVPPDRKTGAPLVLKASENGNLSLSAPSWPDEPVVLRP